MSRAGVRGVPEQDSAAGADLEADGDLVALAEVRPQCVVLEDHDEAPPLGGTCARGSATVVSPLAIGPEVSLSIPAAGRGAAEGTGSVCPRPSWSVARSMVMAAASRGDPGAWARSFASVICVGAAVVSAPPWRRRRCSTARS